MPLVPNWLLLFSTPEDCLLASEMYVIPNFVIIVRAVHEIYESCVHEQTDRQPDFLQGLSTYLDRLLVPAIYVMPNFVKIV